MSAICQRFVQNTWRSDLCSNCFKSLEDHSGGHSDRSHLTSGQRYVPQATILYQTRGITSKSQWRTSLGQSTYDRVSSRDFASQTEPKRNQEATKTGSSQKGILKEIEGRKRTARRSNVGFATEEAMVIGYGGNDYDSDDSFELGSDDGSIDLELLDLTEEDRKVTRMTKNNTEFNSFNKNLLPSKNTDTNNNINKKSSHRTVNNSNPPNDKSPEKKAISQYYFSMKDDPLNSHLHKDRDHLSDSRDATKHGDAVSPLRSDDVILSLKTQNQIQHQEHSKILLNEDYTPLNTTTYSFVSKINQKSGSVDQGSDSDYSTSRLTNGESTDSESFPDSDGVPCQSFLHGTRTEPQTPVKGCKENFKSYDAGSSTSGDISNFSDDSDSHTPPEMNYETANIKISPSNKPAITKDSTKNINMKSDLNISDSLLKDTKYINNHDDKNSRSSHVKVVKLNCTTVEANSCDNYRIGENNKDAMHKKDECELQSVKQHGQKKASEINSLKSTVMEARTEDSVLSSTVIPSKKDNTAEIVQNKTVAMVNQSRRISGDNQRTPSSNFDASDSKNSKTIVEVDNKANSNNVECDQEVTLNDMSHYEFEESPDSRDTSTDAFKTSDDKNDRQLKLAALALELERARCDTVLNPDPIISHLHPVKCTPKVTTPKTPQDTSFSTIRRTSCIPSSAKLVEPSPLPDVLQDMKPKKSRFSLKKLLKRNSKDYESPPGLAANPKAWKKHSFDRSRLSLDIIHPMELVSSTETTPTDEQKGMGIFADPKGRARSLSALPHLANQEETHARKAGTVAERKKKNRPQLVRTPSCSALHSRSTAPNVPTPPRPPKPPPPPRSNNSQPPPPPPPQSRIAKLANSPARPPPPRVPEGKLRVSPQNSSVQSPTSLDIHSQYNTAGGEYANLGYIRSLLTPKKPERPSAPSGPRGGEMGLDDPYLTLEVGGQEEEDHYTYLDDAELKSSKPNEETCTNEPTIVSLPEMTSFPDQPPWTNLQTSYSAIAAAIYESLNDLTTTALQEDIECFQKLTPSLKWRDFYLESEKPEKVIGDKVIFNALHKNLPQIKVTLMVTTQKQASTQNTRNLTRLPVLASFNDTLPSHLLQSRKALDSTNAFIYVLQRSRVTTIERFSTDDTRSHVHQHIKLRDDCFVLLQLIHTLKGLQAEGIEELSPEVSKVLLVQTDHEKPPMLILLPGDKLHLLSSINGHNVLTLCQTTLHMLLRLLQVSNVRDIEGCLVNSESLAEPVSHTFSAIARVLAEEKASSLTQAKGLLEHMLWGPVDVRLEAEGGTEEVLQRWLDLQRAQMVKSLVASSKSTQSRLHVYEEYQLVYLLQASVKSLKDVLSKL